jgi:hypothetical protein
MEPPAQHNTNIADGIAAGGCTAASQAYAAAARCIPLQPTQMQQQLHFFLLLPLLLLLVTGRW